MKISFLLVNEKYPYEGVVRPFLNWGEAFSKKGHEVCFILFDVGEELVKFVKGRNIQFSVGKDFNELISYTRKIKPDILLTDDSIERLKLISKIKHKTSVKTGIYVQILFGVHSIMDVFSLDYLPVKDRLLFNFAKFVPFSLLKNHYKNLLQSQDIILANSNITATFLHLLYQVEPRGIVYPPVNTDVFRAQNVKRENQVLLYLGSHAGDTSVDFARKICEIVKNNNFEIFLIGNEVIRRILLQDVRANSISKIPDEELAKLYSKCKLTICPQKWEMFGYVQVESMACGTPVLAFDCMGPKETVIDGKTGWLSKSKREFLAFLAFTLKNTEGKFDDNFIREHIVRHFSTDASTKRLNELLTAKLNE